MMSLGLIEVNFRATAVAGPTPFVLLGDKQGRLSVLTYPVEGNRATASLVGIVRLQTVPADTC